VDPPPRRATNVVKTWRADKGGKDVPHALNKIRGNVPIIICFQQSPNPAVADIADFHREHMYGKAVR